MKILTANTTTEKNKQSTTPILICKVEYEGSIGTKYYSDRELVVGAITLLNRIISWGTLTTKLITGIGTLNSLNIQLSDMDREIWGYSEDIEIQGKNITIYQYFEDLIEADFLGLFFGIIRGIKWLEKDSSIIIEIVEKATLFNLPISQQAVTNIFPNVDKTQENEHLPIIIGKVEKVKSILIETGKQTLLSVPLKNLNYQDDPSYVETVVENSKEFSQNTYQNLWIGGELVWGELIGRKLVITERAKIITDGHTTGDSNEVNSLKCNSLVPSGSHWVALTFKIATPGGSASPFIYRYSKIFRPPDEYFFNLVSDWFPLYRIYAGVHFYIYGEAVQKEAGSIVMEYQTSYTWCFNHGITTELKNVVVRGSVQEEEQAIDGIETWLSFDDSFYSVNMNNVSYNVTPLTTLEMGFLPKWNRNSNFKDNILYADVTGLLGTDSPSGNEYNPASLIKKICITYIGMVEADIDNNSYLQAVTDTDWIKLSFCIQAEMKGMDLIYDIAFQSRLSLFWEEGKLHFLYIVDNIKTPIATITDSKRKISNFEQEEENTEDTITRVTVSWIEKGETKTQELTNTELELTLPKNTRALNFWCHNKEAYAIGIAHFYLQKWGRVYTRISFSTFLTSLEVEVGDWVTLDFPNFFSTNQEMKIIALHLLPGSGTFEDINEVEIEGIVPVRAGCTGTCQTYTQEEGCDISCQEVCQNTGQVDCNYICETVTQEPCDLICVTLCQFSDISCSDACMSDCQTACQTETCQLTCQDTCQLVCQDICQIDCQIVCEFPENYGCTESCTTVCQTTCQTYCELQCQTDEMVWTCTESCESACTGGCQDCCTETCEWTCQNICEYYCEWSIQCGAV